MPIKSMLYHKKPLFWLFTALAAMAIAGGIWLLARPPAQNTGNPATSTTSDTYTLTVMAGNNAIQVPGYLTWWESKKDHVTGDMRRYEPREIAEQIQYVEIDWNTDGTWPFATYIQDKEVFGDCRLYDDETFEEIEVFTPSGLAPQTYMLHNREPGRYMVSLETSFEDEQSSSGYQFFFGVIIPEED